MPNNLGVLIQQVEAHAPGIFGFQHVDHDVDDLVDAFGDLGINDIFYTWGFLRSPNM